MCPHHLPTRISKGLQEVTGRVHARMDSWVRTCRPVSARSDPFQGKICKNDSMYKETAKRFIVMFVTAVKLFPHTFS